MKEKKSFDNLILNIIGCFFFIAFIIFWLSLFFDPSNIMVGPITKIAGLLSAYYLILWSIYASIKKRGKVKNIIFLLLLILPLSSPVFVPKINNYMNYRNRIKESKYSFNYISLKYPDDMVRVEYEYNQSSSYITMVGYQAIGSECWIIFKEKDYNNELSLLDNFRKNFEGGFYTSPFNSDVTFDSIDINGKKWDFYDMANIKEPYRLYGIRIKEKFYMIEVVDRADDEVCFDLTEKLFDTIKYK